MLQPICSLRNIARADAEHVGELLARLRVGLRHAASRISGTSQHVFKAGELEVDLLGREVCMRGAPVHLTPVEYRLLVVLIERAGQVVTHSELLKAGRGHGKHEGDQEKIQFTLRSRPAQ